MRTLCHYIKQFHGAWAFRGSDGTGGWRDQVMKSWVSGQGSAPYTFSLPNMPVSSWLRRAKRLSQIVRSHLKLLFRLGLLRVCSHSNREPLSLCGENVPKLGIIYTLKKVWQSMSLVWILNCTHANKRGLHAFS